MAPSSSAAIRTPPGLRELGEEAIVRDSEAFANMR